MRLSSPIPIMPVIPNPFVLWAENLFWLKFTKKDGFQYQPQKIHSKIRPKTKGIIINSPSNPTGNLLSPQVIKKIAQLGPWIISDEIYHGLVYKGKASSILEYTEKAVVINGFSKLYAMTGWRLGYLIAPKDLIRPMQNIQQNFFISASSFIQYAGLAALQEAQAEVKKWWGSIIKDENLVSRD